MILVLASAKRILLKLVQLLFKIIVFFQFFGCQGGLQWGLTFELRHSCLRLKSLCLLTCLLNHFVAELELAGVALAARVCGMYLCFRISVDCMLNRVSQEVEQKVMLVIAFTLLRFHQSCSSVVGPTSSLLASNIHLIELCKISLNLERLQLAVGTRCRVTATVFELNSHIWMKDQSAHIHVEVGGFDLVFAVVMDDVDHLVKELVNKVNRALANLTDGVQVQRIGFHWLV